MPRKISENINENISYIENLFEGCYDIVFRNIEVGEVLPVKMSFVYIDGLIDKNFLSEYGVGSLIQEEEIKSLTEQGYRTTVLEAVLKEGLATSEVVEEEDLDKALDMMMSGDTLLFINNSDKVLIIGSRITPARGVDEPSTEAAIRGPRDGFIESLKINTSLVRRRIKDTNLKIEVKPIGKRSKTNVGILYIKDIVNPDLIGEVKRRLMTIDIDAILDSTILEQLIEDRPLSPFPQIENTERPDSAASALYEGRVVLLVDNSPFALMIPGTIGTMLQSTEDYYTRWMEATAIRLIRLLAVLLVLLPSSLYVAMTAYHPGILPTKLMYFLAASRIDVPFPPLLEAFIMELTMELLRESGTRYSGPIGTTIGIVGGLIIGQAAVDAGIVSPLMIIIVAISTIASFAIPTYEFSAALRLLKFFLIILAGILGLFGIMTGLLFIVIHLVTINSFGVPYTSPYSGLGVLDDLKDTLIKAPPRELWQRPKFTFPLNKQRMKRGKKDE